MLLITFYTYLLVRRGSIMAEVKSATRVMRILDLLREYPLGLSISEAGQILDLPKSSVHELLHSMVENSYCRL